MDYPRTLRELRAARFQTQSVKDELRLNLIKKLRSGQKLFPRHRRLSGHGHPATGQRDPGAA
jgi:hypothetical protein